jgi:hypothetical protein
MMTTTGVPASGDGSRQVAARSLPADDVRRSAEEFWDPNAAPRPMGNSAASSSKCTKHLLDAIWL